MSDMKKINDEKLENVSGGYILQEGPEEFYIVEDATGRVLAGPFKDSTSALLENWFTYHQSDELVVDMDN